MKSVSIEISKLPNSLNSILSMHWVKRKDLQETWNMLVFKEWIASGKRLFLVPITVHYALYFSISRARDYDNYIGGTKMITDALKRTFFLRDDHSRLKEISVSFHHGEPRTIITITEAGC